MKLIKIMIASLLIMSQALHAQTFDKAGLKKDLEIELSDTESNLDELAKVRTTGHTVTVGGAGQQIMVLSASAATFLLLKGMYKQELKFADPYRMSELSHKYNTRALGASLAVAGLAEKMVVVADAETLTKIMAQKRVQISILQDQISDLEKSMAEAKPEADREVFARMQMKFKMQADILKGELDALETSRKSGPELTNTYGKYLAAVAQLASAGLLVHSFTRNERVLAGSLLAVLAGEAYFIYSLDKNAVDQTISELQSRRLELISRINQLN